MALEHQERLQDAPQTPAAWPRQARRFAVFLSFIAAATLLWLASGLLIPAQLTQTSRQLQGLVTIFLGIFIEALPFLLAGVLASSAIQLFVSPEWVQRLSPRSPVPAALMGSVLGMVFPVCECGSAPTTRRLLAKGAPLPLGIAFILAAPVVNPVVIASTWVAFGGRPEIVIGRIVLTIVIAAAVGLVVGLHPRPAELLARPPDYNDEYDQFQQQYAVSRGRMRSLLQHASNEFFEMGRYLVIGALIAATLQTIIPRDTLLSLGQGPVVSALVLMGLAIVLSICSTVDAFVALAFANSFLPGSLLAFLVFGPMIDIKSVLMFNSTFQRRTVALIVLLTFQMTLLAAVVINVYF
jgi:hypothetical protein